MLILLNDKKKFEKKMLPKSSLEHLILFTDDSSSSTIMGLSICDNKNALVIL